jgi:hypothetical protein
MSAKIGADDIGFFDSPRPQLLRKIGGIKPEPSGIHVLLEKHGIQSVQRLALGDIGGGIVVALWPAELKAQADHIYSNGRGKAMVAAARQRGWDAAASPHLAFFTSAPEQRLYMAPKISAEDYAERWEGEDRQWIGQYTAEEVQQDVWPWLKERGYASAEDDDALHAFLTILGRRKAHLRPGMRFRRRWDAPDTERLGDRAVLDQVRADVNAILRAAEDPPLPASPSTGSYPQPGSRQ